MITYKIRRPWGELVTNQKIYSASSKDCFYDIDIAPKKQAFMTSC